MRPGGTILSARRSRKIIYYEQYLTCSSMVAFKTAQSVTPLNSSSNLGKLDTLKRVKEKKGVHFSVYKKL